MLYSAVAAAAAWRRAAGWTEPELADRSPPTE
jgi:hypothetical protein